MGALKREAYEQAITDIEAKRKPLLDLWDKRSAEQDRELHDLTLQREKEKAIEQKSLSQQVAEDAKVVKKEVVEMWGGFTQIAPGKQVAIGAQVVGAAVIIWAAAKAMSDSGDSNDDGSNNTSNWNTAWFN